MDSSRFSITTAIVRVGHCQASNKKASPIWAGLFFEPKKWLTDGKANHPQQFQTDTALTHVYE